MQSAASCLRPLRRYRAGPNDPRKFCYGDQTYITNDSRFIIRFVAEAWRIRANAIYDGQSLCLQAGFEHASFRRRKDAIAALEHVLATFDENCDS